MSEHNNFDTRARLALTQGAAAGVVGALVLIVAVVAGGQIFGQLCKKISKNEVEYSQWVKEMATGK